MEKNHARYFVLKFFNEEETILFPDEASRLHFIRLAENLIFSKTNVLVWSLSTHHAALLLEKPTELNGIKMLAQRFTKKYSRYLRKKSQNRDIICSTRLTHLHDYGKTDLRNLVLQIHLNPMHEGLGANFVEYPWTSYLPLLTPKYCKLDHTEVMDWFGGKHHYRKLHHRELVKITGKTEALGGKNVNFKVGK